MRQRGGSFLLRWSASMAGVYFIVASGRDGTTVRHIQIERAGEAGDRPQHVRSVAVRVPMVDESGRKRFEQIIRSLVCGAGGSARAVPSDAPSHWFALRCDGRPKPQIDTYILYLHKIVFLVNALCSIYVTVDSGPENGPASHRS